MAYVLPKPFAGYEAGTVLRDVPLREARSWECNRCGDCCDGTRDDVKKDAATGMPLLVWGSRYPSDFYEERYGQRLIQPVVMADGGIEVGDAFEIDADDRPYTAFKCSFLREHPEGPGGPETGCGLQCRFPEPDPEQPAQNPPRTCGEFPVFGLDIDAAIIDGHPYVPPTGALPRCTWHGIRIVGPWKDEDAWRERWAAQEANRGERL